MKQALWLFHQKYFLKVNSPKQSIDERLLRSARNDTNFKLTVSVVVPAYNCAATIGNNLTAILKQTYPITQIIVVDDGSTDQTAQIVKSFDRVTYVRQSNAGPAKARNRGARETQTDIIFFTDSDCVAHYDWIEKAVRHFSDENVAVVAGSYGIANPQSCLARCIHKEIIFRHTHLMGRYPKSFGSYNFGIRKKVFEQVGGFDEHYRHASGEDNDLSYKVINSGHKILFELESLVDHVHTTKIKKYLFEQYRHGFWRVKMYMDHPHMAQGDDYTFWKDIVEVGLSGLIGVSLIVSCFWVNYFWATLFLLAALYSLEIFYSYIMTKNICDTFFLGWVMVLRAFARGFGFTSGILQFILLQRFRKIK